MAARVMPIDDVGSPKLPHNGKLESKEKKSSEAKPGLSNKPSRFFFMDASGQLVDTTLALSAIIPAFKSSSMEDQYRKVAFSRWRSSPDLNLLAALLVILGALGSMGSWTLPGPFGLSSSRIFAALLTIALVVMLKFRKWALEPRTDRALLVAAVTFSVTAAASTINTSIFLIATLAIVALAVVECDEVTSILCTAIAAVTATVLHAVVGLSVAISVTERLSHLCILWAFGVLCCVWTRQRGFQSRRTYAEKLSATDGRRHSFALQSMLTKISLESESSRVASGSTQLNSESQRRARGSQSDGPLMLALNELKHIASGHDDTTLISAIQNLALLLSRNHAWEPPVVQSYLQAHLPTSMTSEETEVDDETANWLGQMLAPWQVQHKLIGRSRTSSVTDQVPPARSLTAGEPENEDTASASGPGTVHEQSGPGRRRRRSSIGMTQNGSLQLLPVEDVPSAPQTPLVALLNQTADPGFDVELLSPHTNAQPLLCLVVYFANSYYLIESLQLNLAVFQRYLAEIESNYRVMPYHSALHGADVVLNAVRLLTNSAHTVVLSPVELLAALVACAVHDVDHPGVNNAFLISTHHDIALQHNDQSVLENHHLFKAFTIMRKEQCNFLKDMNYSQKQEFRHIVIELVLATDFAFHLKLVNQFKVLVSALPPSERSNIESTEDKLLLWRIVMKCADLGHCSKPVALHKKWAMRVMEEMYRQGDAEKRMGFAISAAMDREKIDMAAKSQAGFLEFVCLPLFQAWHSFSEDDATLGNVEANIQYWKEFDANGERISSLDIRLGMPHERNFKVQAKRRRASIGGVSNVVAQLGQFFASSSSGTSAELDSESLDSDVLTGTAEAAIVKSKQQPTRGDQQSLNFGITISVVNATHRLADNIRKRLAGRRAFDQPLMAGDSPVTPEPSTATSFRDSSRKLSVAEKYTLPEVQAAPRYSITSRSDSASPLERRSTTTEAQDFIDSYNSSEQLQAADSDNSPQADVSKELAAAPLSSARLSATPQQNPSLWLSQVQAASSLQATSLSRSFRSTQNKASFRLSFAKRANKPAGSEQPCSGSSNASTPGMRSPP